MMATTASRAAAATGSNEAERLGAASYLGYAGGDFANNLTFSLTSLFLLIYYTDVAGIAAGAAGTVLVVARIWGAFTDIFAGRVADRRHTRWGKFRPYFLFGGPPLMLITVALFTIPSALSEGGALVYAYVTYMLFYLLYSFLNIPFGSLAGVMSQLPDERAKLSSARTVGAALAIILLAFVVSPQLTRAGNLQRSLTLTTIVFAVVGIVFYLTLFATSREKVKRDAGAVSLKQTINTIRANRPLVLLCASALFVLTGMFTLQTLQVYYARDVLGNADYLIVLSVMSIGGMFLTAPLLPRIVRAFGKRRAYVVCGMITVVGGIGIALSPPSVPVLAFISFAIYGVGLAVVQALMWTMEADTVEYGEWRSGARTEGTNYALLSFARKVGQGLGGGIGAWGIGIGGYAAGAANQSSTALDTIRWVTGGAPAVFVAIGAAIMLAYPLSEQRFQEIVSEVALRRAGGTGVVGEGRRHDKRSCPGRHDRPLGGLRLSLGLRGGSCRCGARRPARAGLGGPCGELPRHPAGTPWHPDHRVVDAQWAACYVPVLESVWRGSIASPGTLRRSKARPTPRDSSDWLARACRLEARVATHVGLVRPGPVIAG